MNDIAKEREQLRAQVQELQEQLGAAQEQCDSLNRENERLMHSAMATRELRALRVRCTLLEDLLSLVNSMCSLGDPTVTIDSKRVHIRDLIQTALTGGDVGAQSERGG